jgi:hypothetical protein
MGQQSQHNKSPNRKSKERGFRIKAMYGKKDSATNQNQQQHEQNCRKCRNDETRLLNPAIPELKKAHADTCGKSKVFKTKEKKKKNASQKSLQEAWNADKTNDTTVSTTAATTTFVTTAATTTTTTAATTNSFTSAAPRLQQMTLGDSKKPSCNDLLSREVLKRIIRDPERKKRIENRYAHAPEEGRRAPRELAAVIDYVLTDLLPTTFNNSNKYITGPHNDPRVEWLNGFLDSGDGMIHIEIPRQDHRYPRDPDYAVIENIHLWICRWELIWNGLQLDCVKLGCPGKLIRYRWPFSSENGIEP